MNSSQALLDTFGPREAMAYDVVIVGAGPAGLAAAIRLKQLAARDGRTVSVVVLEKGSEPGAHILSGAVMDPRAITELLPDWQALGAPLRQPVTRDEVLMLSASGAWRTPDALLPRVLHNEGHYVVSLGDVVKWLAQQAEALGVEIFPGFAATEVLYADDGSVRGVATGHVGLGKDGEPTEGFQLGMALHGRYTVFAEGARGQLGRQLIARYRLDAGRDPQSYGIGLKELWEVEPSKARSGLVVHTAGWPLDRATYSHGTSKGVGNRPRCCSSKSARRRHQLGQFEPQQFLPVFHDDLFGLNAMPSVTRPGPHGGTPACGSTKRRHRAVITPRHRRAVLLD